MTQPLIDISPDETHPEGGHAIIRIRSITAMPEQLRFTISAILDDPDDLDSHAEWSLGECAPLSAHMTPQGLSMLIGPDIVDAPDLQPGVPVSIVLSASGFSAELAWPDLPVTIPGSLPLPLIDASDLRAQKIDTARREQAIAAAAAREVEARETVERAAIEREIVMATRSTTSRADAGRAPDSNLVDALAAATAPISSVTAASPVSQSLAPAAGTAMPINLARDTVDSLPSDDRNTDRVTLPNAQREVAIPQAHDIAAPDIAPHEITGTDQPGRSAVRGNWFSIALAVVALPALLFALWPSPAARVGSQPDVNTALAQLSSHDWMTRILEVGNRSPSGIDSSGVTADEALRRAEAAIFDAGASPNLDERKFWLRKSVSLLLSESQSRWAATQLGALHTASAGPENQPEYRSAKTLWELANASGDTVAACFVAKLYEFGLGVVASTERAQQWYQRAAKRGGCNIKHEGPTPALPN